MNNERKSSDDALDSYLVMCLEFDDLMEEIARQRADHFGAEADAINWGHVGSLEYKLSLLRRVAGKED